MVIAQVLHEVPNLLVYLSDNEYLQISLFFFFFFFLIAHTKYVRSNMLVRYGLGYVWAVSGLSAKL